MAEGRSHFVCGWKDVGLLFVFLTSYHSLVGGMSSYMEIKSDITAPIGAEEGEKVVIPCKINASIEELTWVCPWGGPYAQRYLVGLDLTVTPPVRFGPGYDDGLFNITDDFSLVINNIRPEDENLYYCVMDIYSQNLEFQNTTFVYVHKKGLSTETTPKTECPPVGFSTVTTNAVSTDTTPETECPTDDFMFKVLFGVSIGVLAVSWTMMPCCLRYKKRRLLSNAFRPLDQTT